METLIIIALILGGLILFVVEVFLIPGISIAGIASAVSILYAVYYAFDTLGMQGGFITLGAAAVGATGITIWFLRSKTVDKLALKQTIDYKSEPQDKSQLQVGDIGITTTRLTLIGNIEIKNHIIEVQSADGFIEEKTPVQVVRIDNRTVYVRRADKEHSLK